MPMQHHSCSEYILHTLPISVQASKRCNLLFQLSGPILTFPSHASFSLKPSTIPPTLQGADWQCLRLNSMERGPWQIFSLTMSGCLNSEKHQKAANIILTLIRRSINQFTSRTYPVNHLFVKTSVVSSRYKSKFLIRVC